MKMTTHTKNWFFNSNSCRAASQSMNKAIKQFTTSMQYEEMLRKKSVWKSFVDDKTKGFVHVKAHNKTGKDKKIYIKKDKHSGKYSKYMLISGFSDAEVSCPAYSDYPSIIDTPDAEDVDPVEEKRPEFLERIIAEDCYSVEQIVAFNNGYSRDEMTRWHR